MLISAFVKLFIVSLGLVIIFKLEKIYFKKIYYTMSQLLFDSVTVRQIFSRIVFIMSYSFVSHLIFKDSQVVLLGVFLGSFLIVWPVILNPYQLSLSKFEFDGEENINFVLDKKDYSVLLLLYLIFIISSVGAAYFAINLISLDDIKKELNSMIKALVIAVVGINITGWGERVSTKKVILKNKKIQEYYNEK